MVLIPYALTYTTTVQGRIPKVVRCDKCNYEYVYILEANEVGHGTSFLFLDNAGASERASTKAEAALRESLEKGCEVVPCPACGMVQEHMLSRARDARYRWMRIAGLTSLGIGGVLTLLSVKLSWDGERFNIGVATGLLWAATAVAFVASWVFFERRQSLSCKYDPNNEPVEIRKQRGQAFAVSKDEFYRDLRGGGEACRTNGSS